MTKKILTGVLAAVMAVSFTACSDSKESGGNSTPANNSTKNNTSSVISDISESSTETKPTIIAKGVADDIDSIFDLPDSYNVPIKPNIDEGSEIILEIVPTTRYTNSTLDGLDRDLTFEKMYEYWEGTDTPPIQVNLDDTSYKALVNVVPADFGLTCDDRVGKQKFLAYMADNMCISHRFNAVNPDELPTVFLELVDGEGEIITDPSVLKSDSENIQVKVIASECDIGRGTVNQSTPLIYSYVVRTVNEDGEEIEVSFQVGNEWIDVGYNVESLFSEDTPTSKYYFKDGQWKQYYVLKTSKYTLVLYTVGAGICDNIALIRN